jgi:hypothetical protein
MAKKIKLNLKKRLTTSAVIAATGAVTQIISTAVEGAVDATSGRAANAEMVDYALIAAGIILPEVVKNDMVNDASAACLAVGAYRMATAYNIAGKLGINGIPGQSTLGYAGWNPRKTVNATKVSGSKTPKASGTMG